MAQEQEDFIREFCDLWGDGTAETRPQVERILGMMADDAEWQLWVPGGPVFKGKAALREEIERQMSFASHNKLNIINIVSSDRIVMTERSDYAVVRGVPMPHSMVAVYELNEDGLISAWREYLDTADLAQKSGTSPQQRLEEAGQ
ncbi:nuclear transport factor 2 family protein [Pseudomaricurvus alcaniphilus]|uniref:nuclear transport factor 2 family protein n=1 Tax=Pseudomaricurvus alcaniphilus TaxID=1166482 RepID=UPI00140BF444|nr:nuclear transport factor 2 family protein [Pseudomaricurvus alcaniphilus]NHN38265.1 nuclear transport factor 2 family protein [Pseudomaricurvus alcaniphilus]